MEKDPLKNKTSTDATAPNSATIPTDAAKTALKASVPVKSALSSHETIQEAAETHAKLQVALKKQVCKECIRYLREQLFYQIYFEIGEVPQL